ncbi:hypothetical protein POTOM_061868 [Populus tomentosa]|uniref:ABC-type xenobiotic transporter n=1 Tax=Populus tomentosa TaxID=118781 RepID=A0A8X7XR87_POPTO|nr:hypothetical protein POTOM_061868 [Populus tomentosa]
MVAIYQKQLQLSGMGRRRHSAGVIMNYIHCGGFTRRGVSFCNSFLPLEFFSRLLVLEHCSDQLQSWEDKLKEAIDSPRGAEYECLAKSQIRKSSTTVLYRMSPTISSAVFFVGFVVSSDMSTLDFDLPLGIAFPAASTIGLLAIIAVMASVTWSVVVVAIPAITDAIYTQGIKAPILNLASETSLGVVTIRAFNIMDMFFKKYLMLIDTDARLFFHSNAAMEWLILRVETRQNLILLSAVLLLVLLPGKRLPVIMTRYHCNSSNHIVSVERIKQFMHIPPESPATVEDMRPPSSWPPHGRIELQDLKIRYRPNAPLVLKGITCTFVEGTGVGVVGRTGSGKTTLLSALFRLVQPENGKILIDGLDISTIELKDLRTKLISDEGENSNVGQQQLFCLGRVLLRRNKILVSDEATAPIDTATDAILQRIIRQEFSGRTVITVAHRVPTVADSVMVMVLSYGEMVEYDVPSKLMQTDPIFRPGPVARETPNLSSVLYTGNATEILWLLVKEMHGCWCKRLVLMKAGVAGKWFSDEDEIWEG